jgi:hypothetical protein
MSCQTTEGEEALSCCVGKSHKHEQSLGQAAEPLEHGSPCAGDAECVGPPHGYHCGQQTGSWVALVKSWEQTGAARIEQSHPPPSMGLSKYHLLDCCLLELLQQIK